MSTAPAKLDASPLVVTLTEDALRVHHRIMSRLGWWIVVCCVGVGVAAPLIRVELSIFTLIAFVILIFGVDILRRSRRQLKRSGGISVHIAPDRSTRVVADSGQILEEGELSMASTFPGHIQLLLSQPDTHRLIQVELPLAARPRAEVGAWLSQTLGIVVQEKKALGITILMAIGVALAAMLGVMLLFGVGLLMLGGVLMGLKALPGTWGLVVIFVVAGLVAIVSLVRKWLNWRRPEEGEQRSRHGR